MLTVKALVADPAWAQLKDLAIERTGLNYYDDKDEALADHILDRLACHPGVDVGAYLAMLRAQPVDSPEFVALMAAITVGETFFFRDTEQFQALVRQAVPDRIQSRADDRRLAVWSAGCANGAEAYSLAMMLLNHPMLHGWDISVLGTDIDRADLAEAEAGEYGQWTMRGMPPSQLDQGFTATTDSRWRVADQYRPVVQFRSHNLVVDPPPQAPGGRGFDIVLCRNVLMYFAPPQRRVALEGIRLAMAEGGWLAVGSAEVGPDVEELFTSVLLPETTLYRKTGEHLAQMPQAEHLAEFHLGAAFDRLAEAQTAVKSLHRLLDREGDSK